MEALVSLLMDNALGMAMGETSWAVPLVQSIHIIAIAAVMGAVLISNLRVAGLMAPGAAFPVVERRFTPVMWVGLLVLFVSGALLILSEPDRALLNWVFQLKMILLVLVVALSSIVQRLMRGRGERSSGPLLMAAAFVALGLWAVIVLCGRWIAYS
jgi:uncharacterized membrane protein